MKNIQMRYLLRLLQWFFLGFFAFQILIQSPTSYAGFDISKEFPNYFAEVPKQEMEVLLSEAIASLVRRLGLTKSVTERPVLLGRKTVTSLLGHLYFEVYKAKEKDPKIRTKSILERIAKDQKPLDRNKILGTLKEPQMVSISSDDSAGKFIPYKDYLQSIDTGDSLDRLAFDLVKNQLVEIDASTQMPIPALLGTHGGTHGALSDFLQGKLEFHPSRSISENEKATLRTIGDTLEIPFLQISQNSRKDLLEALRVLEARARTGENPKEEFLNQIADVVERVRFGGAHNRIFESDDEIDLSFRNLTKETPLKGISRITFIPKYVPHSNILQRIEDKIPKDLDSYLMTPEEFRLFYTDHGTLYHGTPEPSNFYGVLRNRLFMSSRKQGTAASGSGGYTTPTFSVAKGYNRNTGVVIPLQLRDLPGMRILNWEDFDKKDKNTAQAQRKIAQLSQEAQDHGKDLFEWVAEKYHLDIIVNGHVLIQNASVIKPPHSRALVTEALAQKRAELHQVLFESSTSNPDEVNNLIKGYQATQRLAEATGIPAEPLNIALSHELKARGALKATDGLAEAKELVLNLKADPKYRRMAMTWILLSNEPHTDFPFLSNSIQSNDPLIQDMSFQLLRLAHDQKEAQEIFLKNISHLSMNDLIALHDYFPSLENWLAHLIEKEKKGKAEPEQVAAQIFTYSLTIPGSDLLLQSIEPALRLRGDFEAQVAGEIIRRVDFSKIKPILKRVFLEPQYELVAKAMTNDHTAFSIWKKLPFEKEDLENFIIPVSKKYFDYSTQILSAYLRSFPIESPSIDHMIEKSLEAYEKNNMWPLIGLLRLTGEGAFIRSPEMVKVFQVVLSKKNLTDGNMKFVQQETAEYLADYLSSANTDSKLKRYTLAALPDFKEEYLEELSHHTGIRRSLSSLYEDLFAQENDPDLLQETKDVLRSLPKDVFQKVISELAKSPQDRVRQRTEAFLNHLKQNTSTSPELDRKEIDHVVQMIQEANHRAKYDSGEQASCVIQKPPTWTELRSHFDFNSTAPKGRSDGAGALIFSQKDGHTYLLLGKERSGTDEGKWSIMLGSVENGETYSQSAKREFEEETAGIYQASKNHEWNMGYSIQTDFKPNSTEIERQTYTALVNVPYRTATELNQASEKMMIAKNHHFSEMSEYVWIDLDSVRDGMRRDKSKFIGNTSEGIRKGIILREISYKILQSALQDGSLNL